MSEKPTSFSIKNWSQDDQPREKLRDKGKLTLSDAELVAILIGSGNRNESAVDLCKRILASVDNNLNALGKVSLKGSYNNNKLYVDRFNSISSDGEINSSGSIPFDLNLGSKNLGQLFSDDILDFHIDSKMKKLPFLTSYISDLDSVIGNFSMTLSLSGFPKDIQRNGKLSIENGLMYSMQLTDPIKALNGKAVIDKNILKVSMNSWLCPCM